MEDFLESSGFFYGAYYIPEMGEENLFLFFLFDYGSREIYTHLSKASLTEV